MLLDEEHREENEKILISSSFNLFYFTLLLFLSITAHITSLTNPNIFTLYTHSHTMYEWLFLGTYLRYNKTCLNCFILVVTVYTGCPRRNVPDFGSVPYVKVYRYNQKHLYQKLNGYGDNGQRSLKL